MQNVSMPQKGPDNNRSEASTNAPDNTNHDSYDNTAANAGSGFGLPPTGMPAISVPDKFLPPRHGGAKAHQARRKLESALRSWPAAGNGVHAHIMRCACLARNAGLTPIQAEARISSTMPRAPSPASEVSSAVRKAYDSTCDGKASKASTPKPLPKTREVFVRRGDGASEADWLNSSPVRIDWEPGLRDALAVLNTLWEPEELLFFGEAYGKNVATVREWRDWIAMGLRVPPHVIPNPLKPGGGLTLDGKPSQRCDNAVASFRYAVAEFDILDKADQLAFWWGFKSAPIAALIDSGGKSIHAWLRVDCPDRAAWERDVEQTLFGKVLIPLGCDPQCRNESRLSRMPGHFRRENNAMQRLLFLDPKGGAR